MLRMQGTKIMDRMIRSSQLPTYSFVPSQAAVLLQKILSWVFIPVLIPVKKAKIHSTFHPVGIQMFHNLKASQMILPGKKEIKFWSVKKEWTAFATNEISSVVTYTLFWDSFQKFLQSVLHCVEEKKNCLMQTLLKRQA